MLAALSGAKGRGKDGLSVEQLDALNGAVDQLEANGGVGDPTANANLDGRWRLLYTSRPGSASPIQRTFTGVDAFSVFQEVELTSDEARINNVVDFGPVIGYLKVCCEACMRHRIVGPCMHARRVVHPFKGHRIHPASRWCLLPCR